ncbi:hypothetical protein [Pajaroellobacter abortibovis]|uniref:Uncharacterized protein n=1 Tax=Pajaroellobacter abortibovis TaxID=1882918 RepID=A0A1L6MZE4_9BACT|nr:hypothetical protein [Pajaroellobacter abortibovis]APS00767.1 hypothetical protein BCY86_08825 [Pajaroellobacter abortibovis]
MPRLQVVARSPRIAQCLIGMDKPGALRWTSFVNPGVASGQESGPTELSKRAACLISVRVCSMSLLLRLIDSTFRMKAFALLNRSRD